eukprot:scaffold1744_cov252-Pinguiococcus_pyrenoidosus.AAC.18
MDCSRRSPLQQLFRDPLDVSLDVHFPSHHLTSLHRIHSIKGPHQQCALLSLPMHKEANLSKELRRSRLARPICIQLVGVHILPACRASGQLRAHQKVARTVFCILPMPVARHQIDQRRSQQGADGTSIAHPNVFLVCTTAARQASPWLKRHPTKCIIASRPFQTLKEAERLADGVLAADEGGRQVETQSDVYFFVGEAKVYDVEVPFAVILPLFVLIERIPQHPAPQIVVLDLHHPIWNGKKSLGAEPDGCIHHALECLRDQPLPQFGFAVAGSLISKQGPDHRLREHLRSATPRLLVQGVNDGGHNRNCLEHAFEGRTAGESRLHGLQTLGIVSIKHGHEARSPSIGALAIGTSSG